MVNVTVLCLPEMTQEELKILFSDILGALMDQHPITQVYSEKNELIAFPPDKMVYGLGQEILAEVSGLPVVNLASKEIEAERRNFLASSIGQILEARFPQAHVECRVYPPNPDVTVWTGGKP